MSGSAASPFFFFPAESSLFFVCILTQHSMWYRPEGSLQELVLSLHDVCSRVKFSTLGSVEQDPSLLSYLTGPYFFLMRLLILLFCENMSTDCYEAVSVLCFALIWYIHILVESHKMDGLFPFANTLEPLWGSWQEDAPWASLVWSSSQTSLSVIQDEWRWKGCKPLCPSSLMGR